MCEIGMAKPKKHSLAQQTVSIAPTLARPGAGQGLKFAKTKPLIASKNIPANARAKMNVKKDDSALR